MKELSKIVKRIAAANGKSNLKADLTIKEKLASGEQFDIKYLFDLYGLDINATDKDGNTALITAIAPSDISSEIQQLITAGSNVNIKNNDGNTALDWAAQYKDENKIITLINAGSDFKDITIGMNPILIWAAEYHYTDLVTALIKAGCDLNIQNYEDDTALHVAVYNGYTDIVIKLIEANSNVNIKNNVGNTAIHNAMLRYSAIVNPDIYYVVNENPNSIDECIKIVAALIEAYSDFKDITIEDDSLLTFAGKNNYENLALAILKRISKDNEEAKTFINTYLSNPQDNIFKAKASTADSMLALSYLLEYVEEAKRAEIVQNINYNDFIELFIFSQQTKVKFYNVVSIFNYTQANIFLCANLFLCKRFIQEHKTAILELQENNPGIVSYEDVRRFTKMSIVTKDGFPTKISIPTEDPNQPITVPNDIVKKLASCYTGYNGPNLQESLKKIRESSKGLEK